jgi:hypothetical protein
MDKIEVLKKIRFLLYQADEYLYKRQEIYIHSSLHDMMLEHRVNLIKLIEYISMHSWMENVDSKAHISI